MSEQTPNSERPPIASAVITRGGKVLLVRRRINEGSLSWQFPGGEIEAGESPGQAAIREVREETGLIVIMSRILGKRVHPNTGRTMIYVACNAVDGQATIVDNDELDDFTWATRDSIAKYIPYRLYGPVQEYLDTTLSSK